MVYDVFPLQHAQAPKLELFCDITAMSPCCIQDMNLGIIQLSAISLQLCNNVVLSVLQIPGEPVMLTLTSQAC